MRLDELEWEPSALSSDRERAPLPGDRWVFRNKAEGVRRGYRFYPGNSRRDEDAEYVVDSDIEAQAILYHLFSAESVPTDSQPIENA